MKYRTLLKITTIVILASCAIFLLIFCVKNYNIIIPNIEKKYFGENIDDSQISQRLNDVKLLDVNRDSVNASDVFNKKKLVISRPIFFTVNPDLSIDNIYLPIKEIPHETQQYLTHITKTFNQNNYETNI
jgi:hypothetical protein